MKRLVFLALSGLLMAFFVVAVWQVSTREWTRYQHQFIDRLRKDERRGLTKGIK